MGEGKRGKGKDEKGKGKGHRHWKPPTAEPAALVAVPQFVADGSSWGQQLSGGLHAFDRGHVLFSTKELYFEVSGQCKVHLAVPAPTKTTRGDNEAFATSGPVELAGRSFQNLLELRSEILAIREAHSKPFRRLRPDAERLMRSVFEHHPYAQQKLEGLEFIQVASNPKSDRKDDATFLLMRNEQDGDDISYVKCLRAMAIQKEGEQMLPLATLTNDEGLRLHLGESDLQLGPASGFGVRLNLESLLLSVHLSDGPRGPWQLRPARPDGVPLRVVLDVPATESVVLRWTAPFDFKEISTPVLALEDAPQPNDLKQTLEAMMKEHDIPGDLSSVSMEELQRIALQVLVRSLDASLHVTRSSNSCATQNQSLLRIARAQGVELTCQQLQDARTELLKVKEEKDAAEATLHQLREEMALLRRKVAQIEGGSEVTMPDGQPLGPSVCAPCTAHAADEQLEQLSQQLQVPLPDPAGTMLRNSLKLMSSEMYSGPARSLWELLQNADDCSYSEAPEIQIHRMGPSDLWIEYNEQGFSWADVKALCSLGSSTKINTTQTGEKGVGFKSAFVLSSRPHILSNPYRFFFDETSPCPLPQVTPYCLPAAAALPRHLPERGTAVYLPLRKDFPKLLDEIVPEALLFLHQLRHITVDQRHFSVQMEPQGHCKLLVTDNEGSQEHHFQLARRDGLAMAFPLSTAPESSLLLATLPIHRLEGLKTPLNAPFELTANREALRENSQRNVKLRDELAELFLQAAAEHELLSWRVWQLQPAEISGFWAPFVQRIRTGLQEVPLIPTASSGQRKATLKQCRHPDSPLLRELGLQPSDLERMNLAIPDAEFLRQIPEGSDFKLSEFDCQDLLGLLQCEEITSTWRSSGNQWRQKVVAALARRLGEVDLLTLRSMALFPTGEDEWSSCKEQIYLALPEGAPEGLLKVLHPASACDADGALLSSMGRGAVATARDVAFAIVQRALGLAEEPRNFSWTNLAYLGQNWRKILESTAADEWLSKQSCQEMEQLLRSVALPSCNGRMMRCAKELRCPFLLGCKSVAVDRSNLLAEPPGAHDLPARLRWELVFLRLGAGTEDRQLELPKSFFAEPGVGAELEPLLDHYQQLGLLAHIQSKCCIPDLAGRLCSVKNLLGPWFQALLGPEQVLDIAVDEAVQRCAERFGVVLKPSALIVVEKLARAAAGGPETLRKAYGFLSTEWREGRLDQAALSLLKNQGIWMLDSEGELSLEQVTDVSWEDAQRQISLWPKDGLDAIFLALGVAQPVRYADETAPSAEEAAPAGAAAENGQTQRPPAKSAPAQPLTWPLLPQIRAEGDASAASAAPAAPAFREPSGAQLPLLGKLLLQIFHSTGGEEVLYGQRPQEEMSVSQIHFTQSSISSKFVHGVLKGRQVDDVARDLLEGRMKPRDLPLVVVKFESRYYTLNNRSLCALRKGSKAQQPLKAQVAKFEKMCPVTAKFIQLRCSSLEEQEAKLNGSTDVNR